jgi:hypothetical protein
MNGQRPNLLRNMDFVEMPKSTPMGQFDMDGMDLPNMPKERPVDFANVPDALTDSVMAQMGNMNEDPRQTRTDEHPPVGFPEPPPQHPAQQQMRYGDPIPQNPQVPQPTPEMDFDLFQFSMIKEMLKNLDVSIYAMEGAIKNLTDKRDMLLGLIQGKENGNSTTK